MDRVMLSAGHFPEEPGACAHDFCEHGEAVTWVRVIAELLREMEFDTAVCRIGPLAKKVHYINSWQPLLAVELHFNSAKDVQGKHIGRGCETLYHPKSPTGRFVAETIHNALKPIFPPGRGAKEAWHRQDRPGHIDYPGDVEGDEKLDYFVAATNCPAVIIEPQFIHLRTDIQARMYQACDAIARAIADVVRYPINRGD